MADKVNVGLRIPSVHPCDVGDIREFVQEAESLGFHSIWVGDHVFHRVDVLDPLSLLAWVAALTSRVRLGTSVMLTAYRNPVLLAKATASLDYLSNGRLTLGVSLGGSEAEYLSVGVPMKERAGRLRENVAVIRLLWSTEDASYQGRYYQIEHARIKPQPVQKPSIPLWFGGHSEPSLRRTAELADGWVGSASATNAEQFRAGVKQVQGFAQERGRDPSTLDFGKLILVSVDQDRGRALQLAQTHWKSYYGPNFDVERTLVYGEPEECAIGLQEYAKAETPEVTLILEPSTLDPGQLHLLHGVAKGFTAS